MNDAYKICPICQARNHRNAAICITCGTTIAEIAPRDRSERQGFRGPRYDYRLGETDLAEESLGFRVHVLSGIIILLIIAAAVAVALISLVPRLNQAGFGSAEEVPTIMPTPMFGPSVTPGPPTATITPSPVPTLMPTQIPTPTPCVQKVAAGDSLIAIVSRCGHTSLDILPTVQAMNRIADQAQIQIGQEIIVPLPSPTFDPAATTPPTIEDNSIPAEANARAERLALLAFDPFAPTATATLLPGLMWHVVQPEENMILIALEYDTNAKVLSDLNPEVEFLLCEFGLTFGGPECTVQLSQGQKLRVPAPTPTTTPIPTASGSQTPTPSATATFNAPLAQSPPHEAFFAPFEQITLRWVGTGRLGEGDVYRVHVTDTHTGASYTADTRELFFIIPAQWQASDSSRRDYNWQVSVVNQDKNTVAYSTEIRRFGWQGTGAED